MEYSIKAHPTLYNGVRFRSRLEARWACFFDLLEWKWEYEPIDFEGWTPDFKIKQPCGHSECGGSHEMYCEVKPYTDIKEFEGHPSDSWGYACLGNDPSVTKMEICHGDGGGTYELMDFVYHADISINLGYEGWQNNLSFEESVIELWKRAGNKVQWLPKVST